MNKLEELKSLLATAGKWPDELALDVDEGCYECPACGGKGIIDADLVKTIHSGCVGMQIYGIGDQMVAMEKLLPLMVAMLPQLIAVAEASQRIRESHRSLMVPPNTHAYEESQNVLDRALESLNKDTDK